MALAQSLAWNGYCLQSIYDSFRSFSSFEFHDRVTVVGRLESIRGQTQAIWLSDVRASNFGLHRHFKGVINFDSQVAHGAFNLGVPEQQLHCSQILGASVNQGGLGPSY